MSNSHIVSIFVVLFYLPFYLFLPSISIKLSEFFFYFISALNIYLQFSLTNNNRFFPFSSKSIKFCSFWKNFIAYRTWWSPAINHLTNDQIRLCLTWMIKILWWFELYVLPFDIYFWNLSLLPVLDSFHRFFPSFSYIF